MKDSPQDGILAAVALFICLALPIEPAVAQPIFVNTGTGTNTCSLILNFPVGEKVVFQHRWGGTSLNAKTLLESVIASTGGELVVSTNDYITPFSSALMTNPLSSGLVVHYQGSYEVPYINAIRWNGPGGPTGAEYRYPDNWWHLWVQGPAHVDQSFAYPEPLDPVDLISNSGWFFGEFSGLADLTLASGASVGFVYGSTNAPISPSSSSPAPPPVAKSCQTLSGNELEMTFETVPNISYILKTKSSLSDTNWSAVTSVTAATATTTLKVPMTNSAGQAFFRLEISP